MCPNLRRKDNVFADRWGTGGNPRADGKLKLGGHNHPIVRNAIEAKAKSYTILRKKGCFEDPAEVVFADWKRDLAKEHRNWEKGIMSVAAIRRWTKTWMKEKAPAAITHACKLRADGQWAKKVGLY